jgi:hypothetical protein
VQSLLLEDGNRNNWHPKPKREWLRDLLRVFDNVKTLRVADRFVGELDKALEPQANNNDEGSALLPRLQEIVRYGPENEFAAFVQAQVAAY